MTPQPPKSQPLARFGAAAAVALALAALTACSGGGNRDDDALRDEGRQVFGDTAAGGSESADGASAPAGRGAWTIVLATVPGENAGPDAETLLQRIRTEAGLADAYAAPREGGVVIALGHYSGPGDKRAAADLARVRQTAINGARAFPLAFLAPTATGGAAGSIPELNLANARSLYGEDAEYTLQVAVYESDKRRESMRMAEQAATIYRRNGDLAFYYHGPQRSMVTVGLFTDRDFNVQEGYFSPELESVQRRHPYNLFNGRGIQETRPGQKPTFQRSSLVQIP